MARTFPAITDSFKRKVRDLVKVHGSLTRASLAIGRSSNGLPNTMRVGRANSTTIRLVNEAHAALRLPKEVRKKVEPAPPAASGNLRTVLGLLTTILGHTVTLKTRLDDVEKRQVTNNNDMVHNLGLAINRLEGKVDQLLKIWS